jgi:hypothetical protein
MVNRLSDRLNKAVGELKAETEENAKISLELAANNQQMQEYYNSNFKSIQSVIEDHEQKLQSNETTLRDVLHTSQLQEAKLHLTITSMGMMVIL